MTTDLSFTNNTIPTFQYEAFSYRISNSKTPLTAVPSSGIPAGYLTVSGSSVFFATTSNIMSAGTQTFTITDASSNVSSNTVTIGSGRFRDASGGNSVSGNAYTFYKGEPIPQIPLYAPFSVSLPTSSPILPPGLVFYSTSNGTVYNISGTPTVTSPQSNHLFLGRGTGSNLGKIITSSNVSLVVSNERMVINVSGSTIVSNMTIGTAITTRAVTASFPPYPSGGALTYSWSGLPDGIGVKDASGILRSSGSISISNTPYTIAVEGTPTLAAATAFQTADISSTVVNIVATRTSPQPTLTSNVAFTFTFDRTILFTSNVVKPVLYVNVPVDPSSNYFSAQVYFGAGTISDISAPFGLPSGLSLSSLVAGRVNLIGTPTAASAGTYTIRAFSTGLAARDVNANIVISNDVVTFTSPAIDACYTFIEARPLTAALTGYYPYPIDFKATAASGFPVTFTGTNIPSGIDFSYPSPGTARLTGSTLAQSGLGVMRIKATAATSDASATRDLSYSVIADAITFASLPTFAFVQNRTITPTQFFATTLSGRTVTSYTSPDLPAGLDLTRTGRLSGTPTAVVDASFTVLASTGFGTPQPGSFNYNTTADSVLLLAVPPVSTYIPGGNVSIDINGIAYSGGVVSNYSLSNFTPSYGLSINSNTGLISGTLTPPLARFTSFYANASVGVVDSSISCTITSILSGAPRTFLINHNDDSSASLMYITDTSSLVTWTGNGSDIAPGKWITDFQAKNTTLDSNTFLLCYSGYDSNPTIRRSRDGIKFTDVGFRDPSNFPYAVLNPSNTPTWYVGGSEDLGGGSNRVVFYRSTDDGITWTPAISNGLVMEPRKSTDIANYYTWKGVALGHSNGVYMIGGDIMMRSPDALRWQPVGGGFTTEVGAFSMTGPVWVATGSDGNSSGSNYGGSFSTTTTLKWSDDQGANWSNAYGDAGDFIGYEVAYVSNTWLSTAMSVTRTTDGIFSKFLCSSNGIDWSNITLDASFTVFTENHLPEVGSLWFDGSNWNAIVKLDGSLASVYSHDLATPLTSGWTSAGPLTPFISNAQLKGFRREVIRVGVPENNTFTFPAPPLGPTVVSPTESSFIAYQYVPITPITFTVTGGGGGFVYYFVDAASLPVGITFDPLTATLSGTSVQLGTRNFIIYIRDNAGVTPVSAQITTVIPRVTRQQTGAGAWTSLVRQYTEVNAAQNSVNGKVLPSTEAVLGEFMRPEPPDSVSAVSCDKPL